MSTIVKQRLGQRWSYSSWWNLVVVLPWSLGAVLAIHGWMKDGEVAKRERTVLGTITAHQPANHNRYGYTFSLNGQSYSGWETPRKEEPLIGQLVTVYYDPADPTQNALTDFAELKIESLGPLPVLLLGIGGLVFFVLQRGRRPTTPILGQDS